MPDDHAEVLARIGEVKTKLEEVSKAVNANNKPPAAVTKEELNTKTAEIIAAVKGGKSEAKEWWEALLEGLGFKDALAAIKDQKSLGSMLPLLIGALAVLLVGKMLDLGKIFNAGLEKLTRSIGRRRGDPQAQGRILAMTDSGIPWVRPRAEAEAAPIIAMARGALSPGELNDLKDALVAVNPHIRTFNERIDGMPSGRQLDKAAKGIERLNTALDNTDTLRLKDITKDTGILKSNMEDFAPHKIPLRLRQATEAAEKLDRAGQNLQERFQALKLAAAGAESAIAGSGSGN
ncbi:hypothetical protein ACWDNT_21625 [Streptomyces sp. NPDC000963]|uniref:hypothetical protein n=1 Tax=Streptomyces sp. NPDC007872 TaxID=3364782 RepID=UPI0036897F5B